MFTIADVEIAIRKLAKNKALGVDQVCPEHLIFAEKAVSKHLCILFNACISHGCVPDSFTSSVIVPVVKDKLGDLTSCNNYRPISLVSMFSKTFEICLSQKLSLDKFFDSLQYGFTSGKGCQRALLTVEGVVNYYTCRGSSVYMAALDASKAFDRVNHFSLFLALMKCNIQVPFLKVIVYWHLHMNGMVRWYGCFSAVFQIKSGIRQGGINSPGYFNIFINDLISRLRASGLGCFISDIYCGGMFFADDILLITASLRQLQLMLDICTDFAYTTDLRFNHLKSHLIQFGLSHEIKLPNLKLANNELCWVNELKYLGVLFVSGKKFSVNVDYNCRKFLGSSFAILQKCKYLSEEIVCKLILTNCLPMLLYGVDSLFLRTEQVRKMSVSFNIVFRHIFHMSKFSSMRAIYNFLGTKTLDCIYKEVNGV